MRLKCVYLYKSQTLLLPTYRNCRLAAIGGSSWDNVDRVEQLNSVDRFGIRPPRKSYKNITSQSPLLSLFRISYVPYLFTIPCINSLSDTSLSFSLFNRICSLPLFIFIFIFFTYQVLALVNVMLQLLPSNLVIKCIPPFSC